MRTVTSGCLDGVAKSVAEVEVGADPGFAFVRFDHRLDRFTPFLIRHTKNADAGNATF